MHPFCRFCQSPTDRNINLEQFGVERLAEWAALNLGVKLSFLPGFSLSICWACVTTFQNWATMISERAKHQGDDFLGSQPNWWKNLSRSKPGLQCSDTIQVENGDDVDEAIIGNSRPPELKDCLSPKVEAVFSMKDIKECTVQLAILESSFIKKASKGEIDLSRCQPKPIKFECKKCNKSFNDLNQRQQHFAKFHPTFKLCPYCLGVFPPSTNLSRHLMAKKCCENAPTLLFFCPKCSVNDEDCERIFHHIKHAHKSELPEQTHRCTKCATVYFDRKQLQDHFQHSHQEHDCHHCGATFKSNVQVVSHMVLEHPEGRIRDFCKRIAGQPLQCAVCEVKFRRESRMAKHFLQYHPELMGILEVPDIVLELAEQEEKYESSRALKCYSYSDGDEFATNNVLLKETIIKGCAPVKRLSSLTFDCPYCKKFFYRRFEIKRHIALNHPESHVPVVSTVSIEVSSNIQNKERTSSPQSGLKTNLPTVEARKAQPAGHKIAISPPEKFPCNYCNTAPLSTQYQLMEHVRLNHCINLKRSCYGPPMHVSNANMSNVEKSKTGLSLVADPLNFEIPKNIEAAESCPKFVKPNLDSEPSMHLPSKPGTEARLLVTANKRRKFNPNLRKIGVATNCPGCGIYIGDAVFFKDHIAECSLVNQMIKKRIRSCSYEVLADVRFSKCMSCNDHFPSMASLIRHAKTVHPETINFKCSYCGFFFPSQLDLDSHFKERHELRNVAVKKQIMTSVKKRESAASKAAKKVKLSNLLRTPTGEKIDWETTSIPKFKRMTIKLTGPKTDGKKSGQDDRCKPATVSPKVKPLKLLRCPHCTALFQSQVILDEHLTLSHATSLNFHACSSCPDQPKFLSRSALDAHITLNHSSGLSISGSNAESSTKSRVSESRIDSPDASVAKPEKCEMCDFVYFDPESKQLHLNAFHTDKKQECFCCTLCNATFASRVVYVIHTNTCRGPRARKGQKKSKGSLPASKVQSFPTPPELVGKTPSLSAQVSDCSAQNSNPKRKASLIKLTSPSALKKRAQEPEDLAACNSDEKPELPDKRPLLSEERQPKADETVTASESRIQSTCFDQSEFKSDLASKEHVRATLNVVTTNNQSSSMSNISTADPLFRHQK